MSWTTSRRGCGSDDLNRLGGALVMRFNRIVCSLLSVLLLVSGAARAAPATSPSSDQAVWCEKVLVDGYEKCGLKDDAWNTPARNAVQALAHIWAREDPRNGD